MDDLGSDQLCKLSCNNPANTGNTSESAINSSSSEDMVVMMKTNKLASTSNSNKEINHSDSEVIRLDNELIAIGSIGTSQSHTTNISNDNVVGNLSNNDEDSDEKEKTDATPEKEKTDDVIGSNGNRRSRTKTVGCDDDTIELKIVEDESPKNLAFTIEFNNEGETSTSISAAAAAKYKTMVERFQNRHRRGASLSKLDDNYSNAILSSTPITSRTSRLNNNTKQQQQKKSNIEIESTKVKLRIRDRSTSAIRDASKRHSWSPRSSIHETSIEHQMKMKTQLNKNSYNANTIGEKISPSLQISPRQMIRTEKFYPNQISNAKKLSKTTTNLSPTSPPSHFEQNRQKMFTPKSTALQLALNKIEFLCPEPPLDDFSKNQLIGGDDCESVSEAGTYTVDGDNYTEEQKEQMNIDKTKNLPFGQAEDNIQQIRPNELPLHQTITTTTSSTISTKCNIENNKKRNNILEINYHHGSTTLKPKISYLEKIKSRVRSMTKSPDKKLSSLPTDIGVFTSVTTSGVLSIKPTLDFNPKTNRRNSLTKSQVDSSEYISSDNNNKYKTGQIYPCTFTDHQKAEYKLNLFTVASSSTNQTDSQILNEANNDNTPVEIDSPSSSSFSKSILSETGLKTAQTKNDWIQEWARSARARSQSATNPTNEHIMSRSYNFEVFDTENQINNVMYSKMFDRFRNHGIGDFEYSSDPNVSSKKFITSESSSSGNCNNTLNSRPPMSPSKIPSPMHTAGRARSVSRTRGSLQDLSPLQSNGPDTDIYLQKTAAAISNLTQSFSRKSSLQSTKSPPSPQKHLYPQHYSADEYSPTHTNNHNHSSGYHGMHKRNLSLDYRNNLMSHSLNTETLVTILDKRNQNRARQQQSYENYVDSPKLLQRKVFIDQTVSPLSIKQNDSQQQSSPIRRSSSFSTKPLSNISNKNLKFTNSMSVNKRLIERNNKVQEHVINPIQKSASSNSFKKMYSDYDNNIQYYINDEDDLINEYCCSSDDYDDSEHGVERYISSQPIESEPITNTRYNKAFLMRIEKSKQKVAGTQSKPSSGGGGSGGGVMACPNTPELPRRSAQNVARSSIRQSVPRDSSLSRMKNEVPNSLASAKKQLLQTAVTPAVSSVQKKVQPKYMDISKYKPVQSANFLRKDETKSTLMTRSTEIKRSPSSASVSLNRADPTRISNRSVKSAGSGAGGGVVRPNSSKRDSQGPKQKEVELAMWRRRATYDPMKAAAEDRKRKEEAKKLIQTKAIESSVVSRSQSFHSGVSLTTISVAPKINHHQNRSSQLQLLKDIENTSTSSNTDENSIHHRWTLMSTESSEFDDDQEDYYNDDNDDVNNIVKDGGDNVNELNNHHKHKHQHHHYHHREQSNLSDF